MTTEQTTTPDDATTTPEGSTTPDIAEGSTTTPEGSTAPDTAEGSTTAPDDRPGSEAAKYRRRLREAEAERDALRDRLNGANRREAERIASAHLAQADDLFAFDARIEDLIGDDGLIDAERVETACAALIEARPGLRLPSRRPTFDGGARATSAPSRGWNDVLRQGRR